MKGGGWRTTLVASPTRGRPRCRGRPLVIITLLAVSVPGYNLLMTETRRDPSKTREARRAATLAARHTPEWETAGQRHLEDEAEARTRAIALRQEAKEAAARERKLNRPVSASELNRTVKAIEAAIREAASDSRMEEDEVAYDVVINALVGLRPPLAAEVRRVMI